MDAEECLDEQRMEMEALEAIYPEEYVEITSVDDGVPGKFSITLVPLPGEAENHVSVKLSVCYSKDYPESLPQLTFCPVRGLTQEQCDELREVCIQEASENLGMAMVFTLCETAKFWLEERNVPSKGDGSAHERMLQRQRDADRIVAKENDAKAAREARYATENAEEILNKIVGTKVTVESFMAWRKRFEEEEGNPHCAFLRAMESCVEKTGKYLFISGKVRAGADATDGDKCDLAGSGGSGSKGAEEVFDESVFLNIDAIDLDGLDDIDMDDSDEGDGE